MCVCIYLVDDWCVGLYVMVMVEVVHVYMYMCVQVLQALYQVLLLIKQTPVSAPGSTTLLIAQTRHNSRLFQSVSEWIGLLRGVWDSNSAPPGLTTLVGSTVVSSKQSKMKISYKNAKPVAVKYVREQLQLCKEPSERAQNALLSPSIRGIQSIVSYIEDQLMDEQH